MIRTAADLTPQADDLPVSAPRRPEPDAKQPAAVCVEADAPSATTPRRATRPTERDYDLFRRHSFDFVSQSELAEEYGLSQQRISQVLRNVEAWMAAHPEDDEAQQVRRSAGNRWESVIGLAMRAFRKSQQEQEVVKDRTTLRGHGADDDDTLVTRTIERTTRPQCGDVRYLNAAMRAMEKQARLFPAGEAVGHVIDKDDAPGEAETAARSEPFSELVVGPTVASPSRTVDTAYDATSERRSATVGVKPASSAAPAVKSPSSTATNRASITEPPAIAPSPISRQPTGGFTISAKRFFEPHVKGSRRDRRRRKSALRRQEKAQRRQAVR